jgi:hypothetical protein
LNTPTVGQRGDDEIVFCENTYAQRRMVMSGRAQDLVKRFEGFNNEMIAFVENCSDEAWGKVCSGEEWPVGVVARHIAEGHYGALGLAKMIVAGKELPDLSMEAINEANVQHSRDHANCTRDEVLGLLRENGSSISSYVAGLSDEDLDRAGEMALVGGKITTAQFIENIIIGSGGDHLANMKAATGK